MILSDTTNIEDIIHINNTKIKIYYSKGLISRNYKVDRYVAEQFIKF